MNISNLRRGLIVFFMALVIPTGTLFWQSYTQMKWEAFHYYRQLAEELAQRIDAQFVEIIDAEESRRFSEYAFLNVAGDPAAKFLQRSPLSEFPLKTGVPGLQGYFQVDNAGMFSTPLLPADDVDSNKYGVSASEFHQRQQLHDDIKKILTQNQLIDSKTTKLSKYERPSPTGQSNKADDYDSTRQRYDISGRVTGKQAREQIKSTSSASQAGFDQINSVSSSALTKQKSVVHSKRVKVKDLNLESQFKSKSALKESLSETTKIAKKRNKRREQEILPVRSKLQSLADNTIEKQNTDDESSQLDLRQFGKDNYKISIFESEIDAFEIGPLNSGHFVMFRKVWRDGQRYIQGLLIDPERTINEVIVQAFNNTALSKMSNLVVAYQGNVYAAVSGQSLSRQYSSAEDMRGTLLYRTRLSSPLHELELIFSVNSLPAGPGGMVIITVTLVLLGILCGGFYLMYRLGASQINLVKQQQDFVSAVSHELKTPLTSIRMYGEMLREGWAEEAKKQSYYQFIFDESERLSRLINNVLQLARMTRNDLQLELSDISIAEIMDGIQSKVITQINGAGFELNLQYDENTGSDKILVDCDYFMQIIINLVDNALKFARHAQHKIIDIKSQKLRNGSVQFSVRDYGPGVPQDQMKKIFKLFYRSENELTRETVGTGIGLALVQQLALAMSGKVDIVNQAPGAEVRVVFQTAGKVDA